MLTNPLWIKIELPSKKKVSLEFITSLKQSFGRTGYTCEPLINLTKKAHSLLTLLSIIWILYKSIINSI